MNLPKTILALSLFLSLMVPHQGISQTVLKCDVYGNASTWSDFANTLFRMNDTIGEYNGCGVDPAIMVAIIDTSCQLLGTTFEGENLDNDFGNFNSDGGCRMRIENHFVFLQNSSEQLDSLESLLSTKIPDEYDVLVYSWRRIDTTLITDNSSTLIPFMNTMGWSDFGTQDTVPFILYGQMGNEDSFQEVYGTYSEDFITFSDTICRPSDTEPEIDDVGLFSEEKTINAVSIYPQPVTDKAFVSLAVTENTPVSITILNLRGELVTTMNRDLLIGENKFELNTEKFESGIYILRLSSANGHEVYNQRFIKM